MTRGPRKRVKRCGSCAKCVLAATAADATCHASRHARHPELMRHAFDGHRASSVSWPQCVPNFGDVCLNQTVVLHSGVVRSLRKKTALFLGTRHDAHNARQVLLGMRGRPLRHAGSLRFPRKPNVFCARFLLLPVLVKGLDAGSLRFPRKPDVFCVCFLRLPVLLRGFGRWFPPVP